MFACKSKKTLFYLKNFRINIGLGSNFNNGQAGDASLLGPGSESLNTPTRHSNVTVKRLVLDAYQFVRTQSLVVKHFGRPFRPSRSYAEIDITYKCNLKCLNCNRSCTQAPSQVEMPVADIASFIRQSIEKKIAWQRIRLLGGEPTLHSQIFDIVDLLMDYKKEYNPSIRLVLGTNYYGTSVHRVLEKLPSTLTIKSTLKSSRVHLFRPFNMAPVDKLYNRFSNYTCGCRIIKDCGLGLTPSGYYMCAIAGGIDRIFGYQLGRKNIPDATDTMADQMAAFCRLCGHFGFQWPTRKPIVSKMWRQAYERLKKMDR